MSASTTPTDRPRSAIAAARLTVTDDLPTPPLPEATAYTRVIEPGCANGMTGSSASPLTVLRSSRRCSSFMTSRSTDTAVTPETAETAVVTREVMVSFIGQPETVRYTPISTLPWSRTLMSLTMPSSVIGRWISGSSTPASADRIASTDGAAAIGPFSTLGDAGPAPEGPSRPAGRPGTGARTPPSAHVHATCRSPGGLRRGGRCASPSGARRGVGPGRGARVVLGERAEQGLLDGGGETAVDGPVDRLGHGLLERLVGT